MNNIIKYKQILFLIVLNIVFSRQFGYNIVQYKNFEWYYTQTEHFDIYVSDSTGYHLDFLNKTSENAYKKIQKLLDWQIKDRISIIIYSSHNEFQQTNVVGSHLPEGVGGLTELLKNRIVIPFDGSFREFKHVIYHELVHAFINDCVYGGNLKNMISFVEFISWFVLTSCHHDFRPVKIFRPVEQDVSANGYKVHHIDSNNIKNNGL